MEKPTQKQILAVSSGWVAVLLNLLPGLGVGYIYQRRWKAYWLTGFVSALWAFIGVTRQMNIDLADPASMQSDSITFYGFLLIAVFTSFEAGIAIKNSRASFLD